MPCKESEKVIRNDSLDFGLREDQESNEKLKIPSLQDILTWWTELNISQRQHGIDPNRQYNWSLQYSAKDTQDMQPQDLPTLIMAYAFRHQKEDVSNLIGQDVNPNEPVSWWDSYNSSQRQHMIDPHELYPESMDIASRFFADQDPKGKALINLVHQIRRGKHPFGSYGPNSAETVSGEPSQSNLFSMYSQMAKQALDTAITADSVKQVALKDDMMRKALKFLNMAFIAHKEEQAEPAMGIGGNAPTGGGIPAMGQTGELKEDHYMGRNVYPDVLLRVNDVYQKLKSRGIPEPEIERAILSEFSWGSHWWQPWPPRKTGGFDQVDHIYPNLIPASAYPPYDPKTERNQYTLPESVAVPTSLSNMQVGGGPRSRENSSVSSYKYNNSGGANYSNYSPDVYTGLGANTIGGPDMRQEPSYNTRAMPEELYYPRWRKAEFEGQPNLQVPESFLKEAKQPKFAKYKYNGHEQGAEICKSFAGLVFDLNETSGRPVLPAENMMYTSTHPNCNCTWDMIDPILSEDVESDIMLGHQKDHVQKINRIIGQKSRYGSLSALNSDGTISDSKLDFNPRHMKEIRESILELRQEFKWLTPKYFEKIKEQQWNGGKFLLIRAASETMTDHRIEGEPYPRMLSGDELHGMARTAIGKGMDINHLPSLKTDAVVMDSEYDPTRKQIQMLVYETDPQIIRAIQDGTIQAVSINGGSPRNNDILPCNGKDGQLCLHPKGVILGENDGIALTYVVTNPNGLQWRGQFIPKATPGVSDTKIEILN